MPPGGPAAGCPHAAPTCRYFRPMAASPPNPTTPLEALRFEQDRRSITLSVLLLAIPVLVFAVSDVLTAAADPPRLALLLGIRLTSLTVVLLGLRRLLRTPDRATFARVVTIASYVITGLVLGVHALRPPELLSPFFFDLLFILCLYGTLPWRWRQQAGPALLLTTGSLAFLGFHHTGIGPVERLAILLMLLIFNALGVALGWSREVAERREDGLVAAEREARAAAERTMRELRVLRGILPICAHCRQVRDERGAWAQLEAYVRAHTEAEFSHGICPACAAEHFPDAVAAPRG